MFIVMYTCTMYIQFMPAKKTPSRIREPVQVYLTESDRAALERAAQATGLSRAEVLRRGLRRFAAEALAEESPALAFLADVASLGVHNVPSDVAEKHDDFLADVAAAEWGTPAASKPNARRRKS